nr:BON domain-containing protein [Burkholderia territorii]
MRDQKIGVEVDHGCVTLDGEVDHAYQSRAAEAMVSRMIGVVGVANRIRVRTDHTVPDVGARIAEALARRARRESAGISRTSSTTVRCMRPNWASPRSGWPISTKRSIAR